MTSTKTEKNYLREIMYISNVNLITFRRIRPQHAAAGRYEQIRTGLYVSRELLLENVRKNLELDPGVTKFYYGVTGNLTPNENNYTLGTVCFWQNNWGSPHPNKHIWGSRAPLT